ncbi:hypothetical protein ID866_6764 [Astraeus odoratus]|nr:hypothetical protein ID866_6764 [Astraeus odoratus]
MDLFFDIFVILAPFYECFDGSEVVDFTRFEALAIVSFNTERATN